MDKELIERLALAFNGGSFANEYSRDWTIRNIINAVASLTREDLLKLLGEK